VNFLKGMVYTGEDDDHKILSQFFLQKIYKKDRDDFSPSMYWTNDGMSLVRFDGMEEVKPSEFNTLQKAKVYVNGDTLPLSR
jgi:predicted peroxiredoxin